MSTAAIKRHVTTGDVKSPLKKHHAEDDDDDDDDDDDVSEEGRDNNLLLIRDNHDDADDEQQQQVFMTDVLAEGYEKWKRYQSVSALESRDIYFQLVEIDYYIEKGEPHIRMFGVLESGESICCVINGFLPYFYALLPTTMVDVDLEKFQSALNSRLKNNVGVEHVEIVRKKPIYGYAREDQRHFIKVVMKTPNLVATARSILHEGIPVHGEECEKFWTYESDVPFALRFMIDNHIVGGGWVKVTDAIRIETSRSSTCGIEIYANGATGMSAEAGEYTKLAPIQILSFDIECKGRKGVFPTPEIDPIIQIASCVTTLGSKEPPRQAIFCVGGCNAITGVDVYSFRTEQEMLIGWRRFVQRVDPDVFTGYNITKFDFPYLVNRAVHLDMGEFLLLGRMRGVASKLKKSQFNSNAYGKSETVETIIIGRVIDDVYRIVQREHKLSSYTLNAVSAEFLGEQKEDVHHSMISVLQDGTNEDRRRLAVYCLKDALLPTRLMNKLMILYNQIEMARVTGVPISYLWTRGQQIKVISQLYRRCRQDDITIPYYAINKTGATDDSVAYEGATVLKPKRGYYACPVATLDFASLYPSIMMAHNLCYSTYIKPGDPILATLTKGDDYTVSPAGHIFVKKHIKRGILPMILENLLSERQKAKKALKIEKDAGKRAVLDGRQLALKVSANSVYGFTGATIGKLPCIPISESVTSFGRDMIEKTKDFVEKHYTIANGYSHDAEVLYGDTDSVMVRFGPVDDLAKCMDLGKDAAKRITAALFIPPISLEFEKVYFPYLLINKKRYAGLYWTNTTIHDKLDAKGLEMQRRDNFPLMRDLMKTAIDKMLLERSPEKAVEYVKEKIQDLLMGNLDMSFLILSKKLSKHASEYKAKQAHVELAARMKTRDPGSAPELGDRVPYVTIMAHKNAKGFEKSEDPIWAIEHGLSIDYQWYIDKLKKPLTRIFEPVISNVSSLFVGDHTRCIIQQTSAGGEISKFFTRKNSCLGCKVPIESGAICPTCFPIASDIYQKILQDYNKATSQYSRIWTQCQDCQKSRYDQVICGNKECAIFYARVKAGIDCKKATEHLAKFDNW